MFSASEPVKSETASTEAKASVASTTNGGRLAEDSPTPSVHRPQFAPLQPENRLLPVAPADSKNFADLYPERRGREVKYTSWQRMTGQDMESVSKRVCEDHVIRCFQSMPMVRSMVGALAAQGCPIDLERHISCDSCSLGAPAVAANGGYDERTNQVFICANSATSQGSVHGMLVRGLIAAFDSCVAKVNHRNVDHLACTEVRKANLANCNFALYMCRSDANFAIQGQHADCVRKTAIESMVQAKFIDHVAATEAVDRVFSRCYQDLEPFGRRCRSMNDMEQAHAERYLLGYK
jgi:inner membrane protease ATP23